MLTDTTFRLVVIGDAEYRGRFGRTAPDPSLAKLVPGHLAYIDRSRYRLGMERTDWVGHLGKMKIHRSVVVDAETQPGQWTIGASPADGPAPTLPTAVLIPKLIREGGAFLAPLLLPGVC